jgi:hypothetical protein
MTIKEHQVQKLEEYINEGISCQKSALEGKKQYLYQVQEWLINVCKENKESEPYWIWAMSVPQILLGVEIQVEDNEKFYSNALSICLQQLNDLYDNYYRQRELEEIRTQTVTAIKNLEHTQQSLKHTQTSLRISIIGLIISILAPIIISIVTINCCTSTIKVEEQQYEQIKVLHNAHSTNVNDNGIYR